MILILYKKHILLISMLCFTLAGCATDEYGNERPFTDAEKGVMIGAAVGVLAGLTTKNKKNKAKSDALTLVADERTNSILMGGDKSTRLSMKALIAHLDTPSEMVGNTHVIYLHYAKAKDLVSVLTGVGKTKAKAGAKGKKTRASNSSAIFNIQADESSNTLVITAAPDVYRSLENVIRKLDIRRAQVMVEAIITEISANKTNELGIQWFGDGSPW